MKMISENVKKLEELYILNLRKALDMERRLDPILIDLTDRSTDEELSQVFLEMLDAARLHKAKLEALISVRTLENTPLDAKAIPAFAASIASILDLAQANSIRDIALIGAAQEVQHYKISAYGTLQRWAEIMSMETDREILESLKAEEVNGDLRLTQISERVNVGGSSPVPEATI
jgi:ferritin-like metal-binding protein YciE